MRPSSQKHMCCSCFQSFCVSMASWYCSSASLSSRLEPMSRPLKYRKKTPRGNLPRQSFKMFSANGLSTSDSWIMVDRIIWYTIRIILHIWLRSPVWTSVSSGTEPSWCLSQPPTDSNTFKPWARSQVKPISSATLATDAGSMDRIKLKQPTPSATPEVKSLSSAVEVSLVSLTWLTYFSKVV